MNLLTFVAKHPLILVFVFVNLAIGFWAHRKSKKNSFEDYALASRHLPTGVLIMTLLGTFVASGNLTVPDFFVAAGVRHLWVTLFFFLSFVFIGAFLAPCLVYFNRHFSMGDLMGTFYGRLAQMTVGLLGIISSLLIVSSQISVIGKIGEQILDLNPTISIVLIGVMVVCYSAWGGMRAVSYTDVLQMIMAFFVFFLILKAVLAKAGGIFAVFQTIQRDAPDKLILWHHPNARVKMQQGFFLALSGGFVLTPPILQRMLMSKDTYKVRAMWYQSSFFYLLLSLAGALIGFSAWVAREELGFSGEMKGIISHVVPRLFAHGLWRDVIFVGLLAVCISTIDSYLHAIGVSFMRDLVTPLLSFAKKRPLSDKRQFLFTKLLIFVTGLFAVGISAQSGASVYTKYLYQYAILTSGLIIIPMVLGIIGIKTHVASLYAHYAVYTVTLLVSRWQQISLHNAFMGAIFLGTFAYFIAHLVVNRGIATVKRGPGYTAQRVWVPTWKTLRRQARAYLTRVMNLPQVAKDEINHRPAQPLAFSLVMFALYALSSGMATGASKDVPNFMAVIYLIGITLCVGLMLQGIWPQKLKEYFPLYWMVTVFFCLPVGGMLAFLRAHDGVGPLALFWGHAVLLAFVVRSRAFVVMNMVSFALTWSGWKIAGFALPSSALHTVGYVGLVVLGLFVLFFGQKIEEHADFKVYLSKVFTGAVAHETKQPLEEVSMLSVIDQKIMDQVKPTTNAQGEEQYTLTKAQYEALQQRSQRVHRAVGEINHEIGQFRRLVGKEITMLDKERVSMKKLFTETVKGFSARLTENITIKITTKKDFQAVMTRTLFPNILTNFINNAYMHGAAKKVTITIDGDKRQVTIHDNGRGMDPKVLSKIFGFRYTTRKGAHDGIGLSFVKLVFDALGIKIQTTSQQGGESFTEFVWTFGTQKEFHGLCK